MASVDGWSAGVDGCPAAVDGWTGAWTGKTPAVDEWTVGVDEETAAVDEWTAAVNGENRGRGRLGTDPDHARGANTTTAVASSTA